MLAMDGAKVLLERLENCDFKDEDLHHGIQCISLATLNAVTCVLALVMALSFNA